ncbi:MAG: Fe-S cluster assembly ATPase SufC [Chloroflexi bacterium]|nr:Fe-S cluster assembly ATPase SufC [Chloroflexota bacterium]
MLEIAGLRVQVNDREILCGLDLAVGPGEVHALMGPNGSGKTTLAHTLAGLPSYRVVGGAVRLNGKDLLAMEIDERARAGLFIAYQYPLAIPGVRMEKFLRLAVRYRLGEEVAKHFDDMLEENMALLHIDRRMLRRYLNEGFSGGEKKQAEILQMAMLQPDLAVLDETDSGLDVDALRIVGEGLQAQLQQRPAMGVLVITHYPRLLAYVQPEKVHVMAGGRIIRTGETELPQEIEERGYGWLLEEVGLAQEAEELTEEDREPPNPFHG